MQGFCTHAAKFTDLNVSISAARPPIPSLSRLHLDFTDKDSRISCDLCMVILPDLHLDAMHPSALARCSEEDVSHVAEVLLGARSESHYSLLVSALIRMRRLCVASAEFHICTYCSRPRHLVVCDFSGAAMLCRVSPHSLTDLTPTFAFFRGTGTRAICTLCFSSPCTGSSNSQRHDGANRSAVPWL